MVVLHHWGLDLAINTGEQLSKKTQFGSLKTRCIAREGLSSRTFWWGPSVTRSGGFSYTREEKSSNRRAPTRMFDWKALFGSSSGFALLNNGDRLYCTTLSWSGLFNETSCETETARLTNSLTQAFFCEQKNLHYHHRKKIFWRTFLASKKNFPGRWWIQKPNKNQETTSTTEIFPLWPPFFRQQKSCTGAGRCMLSFSQCEKRWRYALAPLRFLHGFGRRIWCDCFCDGRFNWLICVTTPKKPRQSMKTTREQPQNASQDYSRCKLDRTMF